MKRQVEVFTANCPICDPVVEMVRELACDECEVTTYDLVEQFSDKTCLAKMNEYGVHKIPAVAVNGKLLDCCKDSSITKERLTEAGIGQIS
ncbi:MAG: thioredoxin family protein [Allomuricauda sp.]|uniref:Thioredoxin family protein n=1 Tax=Maribacter flavus TaxID=1658664 RepID=A0ABU7IKU9_9FLAO|nr:MULTISPECIES: thioredoxin family protein [Flavobacteriaceae]MDC6406348.1 thioredoxin family protein [Maribacter sp. PR66]MEE1973468.1 thioredoxin family protein [Maribacter flavus]NDV17551.1 glutaredoxin [Muricauda sp. TY007]